jgi:hypothetical protein
VQGFSSRPLLHYYVRDESNARVEGANRTYTFVEAVTKFGSLVPPVGLLPAYKRARPTFNGCMEQYFVILKEAGPSIQSTLSAPNLMPLGAAGHPGDWRGSHRSRGPRGQRGGRGGYSRGSSVGGYSRGSLVRPVSASRGRGFSSRNRDDTRKRLLESGDEAGTPSKKNVHLTDPSLASQHPSDDFDMTPLSQ